MNWEDKGFVLSVAQHGETSAIIHVLTKKHGRHAGLVRGGRSRRLRPVLQPGNGVRVNWYARLSEHLGNYTVELDQALAAGIMESRLSLSALNAVTGLAMVTLPEREPHPDLYAGVGVLLKNLTAPEIWPALYVHYELALLKAVGYGIDISRCAATGVTENLTHISPRSGRAVSAAAAAPYRAKLFELPGFFNGNHTCEPEDLRLGLKLSEYFLETRIFHAENKTLPDVRFRLMEVLNAEGLM